MENDQAARLRTLVREARRVAVFESGPPLIAIAAVEPEQHPARVQRLCAALTAASHRAGVRLREEGYHDDDAQWLYTRLEGEAGVEGWDLQRASVLLMSADVSATSVLASYGALKRQHRLGPLPPVWVLFERATEEEGARAFESLRATCERFLGWESLDWGIWSRSAEDLGLARLVDTLALRLGVAGPERTANPLVATTPKTV